MSVPAATVINTDQTTARRWMLRGRALLPVVQGGMGIGVSAHRLAGSVAALGALGTISSVDLRHHHPDLLERSAGSTDRAALNAVNLIALDREIRAALTLAGGRGAVAVNVMKAVADHAAQVRQCCESGAHAIVMGAGLPLDLPDMTRDFPDIALLPILSDVRGTAIVLKKWLRKNRLPDAIVIEHPRYAGGHLGATRPEEINHPRYDFEPVLAGIFALMRELGLGQPLISWHTVRDNFAEVGAFLGIVGGSLGKIAMDVKLLMQTEVAEVFEPFAPGRGSSSTMPQKRNPISCLYIHANVSVVRQLAASLMDAMVADHERSTGPWEIEWVALPEIFCLMSGALKQTKFILAGLEVDAAQMRRNIDLTHGLVMSEAVMMGLGPFMGRETAHDLVYDICRAAVQQRRPLIDLLAEHPDISRHVSREQLEGFCDPMNNLGQAGVMVDRVLASLRP